MKDNKGFLELEGKLTKIGKRRALEDNFEISKFSVSDDGINYRLINKNLIDPNLAISRSMIFNNFIDSSAFNKHKILVNKPRGSEKVEALNAYEFHAVMDRQEEPIIIFEDDRDIIDSTDFINNGSNPIGFPRSIPFPRESENNNNKDLSYYITNSSVASQMRDVIINIPYDSLPDKSGMRELSLTLHDSTYFDIFLHVDEFNRTTTAHSITKNWLNAYPEDIQKGRYNAEDVQRNQPSHYPKTITSASQTSVPSKFILRYRGNFSYENKGRSNYNSIEDYFEETKKHKTYLTIRCEKTGYYQDITLQLIITESKSQQE